MSAYEERSRALDDFISYQMSIARPQGMDIFGECYKTIEDGFPSPHHHHTRVQKNMFMETIHGMLEDLQREGNEKELLKEQLKNKELAMKKKPQLKQIKKTPLNYGVTKRHRLRIYYNKGPHRATLAQPIHPINLDCLAEEPKESPQPLFIDEIPYYTEKNLVNFKAFKSGSDGMISFGKLGKFGLVAAKQFKISRDRPIQFFKKEIDILIQHKHPNIIQLHGILWDGVNASQHLGYIMGYAEKGSLHDVIHNSTKSYDLSQISIWVCQIVPGLQFLHSCGIIHRDIKPDNILVTSNNLQLADFGRAKNINGSTTAGAGTVRYMAPEVIDHGKCSTSSDGYSLTITIWEIFERRIPYAELGVITTHELSRKIIHGTRPTFLSNNVDRDTSELIQRGWQATPSLRGSLKEILDFFQERLKRFRL